VSRGRAPGPRRAARRGPGAGGGAMHRTGREIIMGTRSPRRMRHHGLAGWMFVLPFILVFAFVFVVPLLYSLWISLFEHKLIGGLSFAGASNFIAVFRDPLLWRGIARVALFTAIQVPLMLIISASLALALDSGRLYGTRFFRISIFIPYAVEQITLRRTTSGAFSVMQSINPAMAVAVGLAFGEIPDTGEVIGVALVICAVIVTFSGDASLAKGK